MGIVNQLSRTFDRVNGEHLLLLSFGAIALYMVITANQWGFNSRVFPQLMGTLMLIGVLLLLFESFLPGPIRALVTDTTAVFEESEETEMTHDDPGDREIDRPGNPVMATAVFITGYGIVGYLFSLLIASPLFVIAYMVWFRQRWYMILFLAVLSVVISYVFATIVGAPVDDGRFVEGLLG